MLTSLLSSVANKFSRMDSLHIRPACLTWNALFLWLDFFSQWSRWCRWWAIEQIIYTWLKNGDLKGKKMLRVCSICEGKDTEEGKQSKGYCKMSYKLDVDIHFNYSRNWSKESSYVGHFYWQYVNIINYTGTKVYIILFPYIFYILLFYVCVVVSSSCVFYFYKIENWKCSKILELHLTNETPSVM